MSRIFSFFLIIFCASVGTALAAQPSTYLVENVPVSVKGKSPSDARNMAVATARRDAFLILLTRLELNINLADKIKNEEISDMVRSEQINDEKIAGNTYSATFNVMFAKNFVDHILGEKNITTSEKVEKKQETFLLIPVKIVKRKAVLWEAENDWKAAIEKVLGGKKLTKNFVIPADDMDNIAILNRDNVENIDFATLEPILSRYNSDAAYTALFSFDNIENKAVVNVFYIRKLQRKQIKLSLLNVDRISYEDLLAKVAAKTIDYLTDPKLGNDPILALSSIKINIAISSLGNWLMIKNKIENSGLVNQLNIESISRDHALISVNYTNTNVDVVDTFNKAGILLSKQSEGLYVIN